MLGRRDRQFQEFLRRENEDLREFIREITLRNEKVWQAVVAELQGMREETRANTKAVLSVLDRLERMDGTA
jgi:hypothetical protein